MFPRTESPFILACVDAPDPDNLVMLLGLARLFPDSRIDVVLTGRPVRFNAGPEDANWDWDEEASRLVQRISAGRILECFRRANKRPPIIYDGGIAPRTVVPHWKHFQDYFRFWDGDPLTAVRYSPIEPIEKLIRELLAWSHGLATVVVGGPMTGLAGMITRCPELVRKFRQVHAMFASWGNTRLMDLGCGPRGIRQFNVAADPFAANLVLRGLPCPIYLLPTEVTRVPEIGFENPNALRGFLKPGRDAEDLCRLYEIWYEVAVRPRQAVDPGEKIFVHDLAAAFSLDSERREKIYEVVPIEIDSVPVLPHEGVTEAERAEYAAQGKPVPADLHWGEVRMRETTLPGNRFAATRLKPGGAEVYLETLRKIFA